MNPYIYAGLGGVYRQKVRNNLSFVKDQIKTTDAEAHVKNSSYEDIIIAVSHITGVESIDILGSSRLQNICFARHMAVAMIRSLTTMPLKKIGLVFNKNHATIINSIKASESLYKYDPKYRDLYNKSLEVI